jgi:hypothetical protein
MNRTTLVILLSLAMLGAAQTANKLGLMPQGTLVPGHVLVVGTTANDAADGGPPGQALTIGQTVTGAVINSCLTVDSAGKLAQADCALAH